MCWNLYICNFDFCTNVQYAFTTSKYILDFNIANFKQVPLQKSTFDVAIIDNLISRFDISIAAY